jgi:hypothetical protein
VLLKPYLSRMDNLSTICSEGADLDPFSPRKAFAGGLDSLEAREKARIQIPNQVDFFLQRFRAKNGRPAGES